MPHFHSPRIGGDDEPQPEQPPAPGEEPDKAPPEEVPPFPIPPLPPG